MKVNNYTALKFLVDTRIRLLILGTIISLIVILRYGTIEWGDSLTYMWAWDLFLKKGELDPSRTPVYPCLLGFSKIAFGLKYYKIAVVFLQHLLSVLSVYPFYGIAKILTSNRSIVFGMSLCYIIVADVTYNGLLLTESLSCTCIVFVIYFLVKFYTSQSLKYGLMMFTVLAFLLLLRPAQIYVLPVVFLVLVLSCIKKMHKFTFYGLVGSLFVCVLLVGYVFQFKSLYGYYSISNVSDINQYYILRMEGLLGNDSQPNDKTSANISMVAEEIPEMIQKNGYYGFHTIVANAVRENRNAYVMKTFDRFYDAKDNVLLGFAYFPLISKLFLSVEPHVSYVYLLLIVFPWCFLWQLRKKRQGHNGSLFVVCLIYLLLLFNVVLVIVGAPNDWGRLLYPSVPIVILMTGVLVDYVLSGMRCYSHKSELEL